MTSEKLSKQLKAIRKVIDILNTDWIVEGCGDDFQNMGCASCRAIELKLDLKMLACNIMENEGRDASEVSKW